MNGRLEKENKYNSLIDECLKNMPDFIRGWLGELNAKGYTGATRYEYLGRIKRFLNYINSENVQDIVASDITKDIINRYFVKNQSIEQNGKIEEASYSYRNNIYISINSLCIYLFENGYLESKYNLPKPKNNNVKKRNKSFLEIKDLHKILNAAKENENLFYRYRDMAVLAIFMNTGMRKSALQSINKEDIDFENKTLRVIDKGHKEHIYKLNDSTMEIIIDWINYYNMCFRNSLKNDALFVTQKNIRMSDDMITRIVMKYSEDALGIVIRPHQLRAAFCSILYDQTRDIEFVRRAVGHSRLETTQRYIITDESSEREKAADIMEQIF